MARERETQHRRLRGGSRHTVDLAEPRFGEVDCEEPVRTLDPLQLHVATLEELDMRA